MCSPPVRPACAPRDSTLLSGRGGIYLEDCQIARASKGDGGAGVEPYAVNPAFAERLWQLSEELVGQSFAFD